MTHCIKCGQKLRNHHKGKYGNNKYDHKNECPKHDPNWRAIFRCPK